MEDDQLLRSGIVYALRKENYLVYQADSLESARNQLNQPLALVLLDLGLPDGDGRELLTQLRQAGELPVLILTAQDSEADIVESYDLGCDDYLTKPFTIPVLLRHIRAVLRRAGKQAGEIYYQGQLSYHFSRKELRRDTDIINLTATECRLLEVFLKNRNQVLTREMLLDKVWDQYDNYVDKKTLNVNIRRLREKVESDPHKPVCLQTVFGIGYKWSDGDD